MIRLEFVGGLEVFWDEKTERLEEAIVRANSKKHGQRTPEELVGPLTASEDINALRRG